MVQSLHSDMFRHDSAVFREYVRHSKSW